MPPRFGPHVEPAPVARELEVQVIGRARRRGEADPASVSFPRVGEIDLLPEEAVDGNAGNETGRRQPDRIRNIPPVKELLSHADRIGVRVQLPARVELPLELHARIDPAIERVPVSLPPPVDHEQRLKSAEEEILRKEGVAEEVPAVAVSDLRHEPEVGAEVRRDVLVGRAPEPGPARV